jgi:replicative DNA helicase
MDNKQPIIPPQNTDAEASLLGAILIDSDAIVKIADIISPTDFYDERNGRIYEAITQLYEKHSPIDVLTLSDQLKSSGFIDFVGGAAYLTQLTNFVPTAAHVEQYAEIVSQKAIRRRLIQVAQETVTLSYNEERNLQELIEEAETRLFEVSQKHVKQDIASVESVLSESFDRLDELHKDKGKLRGIPTGFKDLDNILAGLQRSDLFILAARPSMGKAQPLDAPILKKDGWTTMGDLKIGDSLASIDGKASKVIGIFPQGKKQIYRLTFSDGRSVEATGDHLWRVNFRKWAQPKILTTDALIELLDKTQYKKRLWIDQFNGKFGSNKKLPINPWVLGMLLGDGDLHHLRVSTAEKSVVSKLKKELGSNYEVKYAGKYDYRVISPTTRNNPLRDTLRRIGLWNLSSHEKFVPEQYLNASLTDRIALLQGLMDADGWVEKHGTVRFSSSSEQLARDVVTLARSLGAWVSIKKKQPFFTYKNIRKQGLPAYVVNIVYDNPKALFTIRAKKARAKTMTRQKRLTFASITPTRKAEAQCIAVSHPEHLYISENFTVTHNTAFSLGLAHSIALKAKEPVLIFSLEMSKEQLVDRMLATESGVDAWALRTGNLTDSDFEKIGHAMGSLSEAQIFIDDTPGITVSDLRTKARREAHIRPLGLIIVDYLQLMSGGSRFASDGNRVQEISAISRGLKGIARELNVPLIALSQLSRSVESRTPQIPQLQDLRESGSIEQDADVVAFLYREDYYNPESERKNIMDIFIKKHRNGPTGAVELYFDREKQRFRSVDTRHSDPFA